MIFVSQLQVLLCQSAPSMNVLTFATMDISNQLLGIPCNYSQFLSNVVSNINKLEKLSKKRGNFIIIQKEILFSLFTNNNGFQYKNQRSNNKQKHGGKNELRAKKTSMHSLLLLLLERTAPTRPQPSATLIN
jgi:cellulose biosynthesis protein BcsQ